jgi:hypothetical protein
MYFFGFFIEKNEIKTVDFFFTKLNTEEEKLNYIKNINNNLVTNHIKALIEVFTVYNYADPRVNDMAIYLNVSKRLILKWHRTFHFNVLKEFWDGKETKYFTLLKNNLSFQYLLSLENEEQFNKLLIESSI